MGTLLFFHVLGVILLLGNAFTVTFWKLRADYSNDLSLKLQTVKNIMILDYIFTLPAIVMILGTGHLLAGRAGYSVFAWSWLGISYGLFILSGVIWLFALLPLQSRMIREGKLSYEQNVMTKAFSRASRTWNFYGVLATLTPIASMILMVWKPTL
ncbi:DUF2269 family protein [Paenibacillus sp. MMS18-CY102]|uniref:DUF2269 family protein n=1 Tax=Paenibacillus sp. MMS18-CY102 TaxID=2682849 RepID=UPI001365742F|nr:DUF2269 family protein [Paenibacillus sp. MMS18-CY102]MWC28141.1 DUF2269 family protein [Paenibacillus sp. MMS18-CY102]